MEGRHLQEFRNILGFCDFALQKQMTLSECNEFVICFCALSKTAKALAIPNSETAVPPYTNRQHGFSSQNPSPPPKKAGCLSASCLGCLLFTIFEEIRNLYILLRYIADHRVRRLWLIIGLRHCKCRHCKSCIIKCTLLLILCRFLSP